jgi:crotonobetainyl-CoA:carnitine CoA-transferase CaiB-like acyl-CoA transferase
MSAPYQAVKASDTYFVIGAANQKLWITFLDVLGRQDLAGDVRFVTNSDRVKNRAALIEALEPTFAQKTADEWIDLLLAAGVPAGQIYNYEQALASEHVKALEMVQDIPHPVEGSFKALGFPVKLSGTPQQVRFPPPLLNEHSEEIRRELVERGLLEEVGVSEVSSS